jgi:hypothetical protein
MPGSVEDPRDLEAIAADFDLGFILCSPFFVYFFVRFSITRPVRRSYNPSPPRIARSNPEPA